MSVHAKDGKLLDDIVALAIQNCRCCEIGIKGRVRGRPPLTPYWVLAAMIAVGIILRKKSKTSQYTWWDSHRSQFARWFANEKFPGRSTFFDRYRKTNELFCAAIKQQGEAAIKKGWADAICVSVDKSLIAARGRKVPYNQRTTKKSCKRVDKDASWGYSKHHGWVYGYSIEVVLSSSKTKANWPLLASADIASRSEHKSFPEKIPHLPSQTEYALADAGYDSNAIGEAVEESGKQAGVKRRFLCPEVPRPNNGKSRKATSRQSKERQLKRKLRDKRRAFLRSRKGKSLYARRKTTIEPFNNHFKELFDIHVRVWHWGLDNNRTQLTGAVFAYQLLLTLNHKRKRKNACIKWILDAL